MTNGTLNLDYLKLSQLSGHGSVIELSDYSIIVMCASTESRCLALRDTVKLHRLFDLAIVLSSSDMKLYACEEENLSALESWCSGVSREVKTITNSFSKSWKDLNACINSIISRIAAERRTPIDVTLDISCMPKPIFLGLLSCGIRHGYLKRIGLLYHGASYKTYEGDIEFAAEDGAFSKGAWRPALIPYLEGEINAGRQRTIIASIGFEAMKSRLFIRSYQPDHCIFIRTPISTGGTDSGDFARLMEDKNYQLLNDYEHDSKNNAIIKPTDAIEVVRHIKNMVHKYREHEIILFCLGTKPHALAMGLYSLHSGNIPVIPRVPEDFVPMRNEFNGDISFFQIDDLSLA